MLLPLGWAEHHEHALEGSQSEPNPKRLGYLLSGAKEGADCLWSVR